MPPGILTLLAALLFLAVADVAFSAVLPAIPLAQPISAECFSSFETEDASLLAWARSAEPAFGRDIRRRSISDDWADYLIALRARANGGAAAGKGSVSANRGSVRAIWDRRAKALCDYWQYAASAVTHNRDLWTRFLSMNALPEATPHEPAIDELERRLLDTFARRDPGPDWTALALTLSRAYVNERQALAERRVLSHPAVNYQARHSQCPAPVTHGYGKETPEVGDRSRSLGEFYPTVLRRNGTEGNVILSIAVNSLGCATGAGIAASSGVADLDAAALQWYETANFLPAERDGRTVDATMLLDVKFQLDESGMTGEGKQIAQFEKAAEGASTESRLALRTLVSFSNVKIPGWAVLPATSIDGDGIFQVLMHEECKASEAVKPEERIRALLQRQGHPKLVIRALDCLKSGRPMHLIVEQIPLDAYAGIDHGWVEAPLPQLARLASAFFSSIEPGTSRVEKSGAIPFSMVLQYEIKLPDGYSADTPLPTRKIDLGAATLEQRVEQQADGRVALTAEFHSPKDRYTATERSTIGEALERAALEQASLKFTFEAQRELESGAEREALAKYRSFSAAAPKDAYRHAEYAFGLDRLCLPDAAQAELRRAVQLDANYAYAYYALGWQLMIDPFCRARASPFDYSGAEHLLREAVRLDPGSVEYRFTLAQLLEFDTHGVRFGATARLDEASKEFDGLRRIAGYRGEHDDEILEVLLLLGRHAELQTLISSLPTTARRQAISLADTALEKGIPAAVGAAKDLTGDDGGNGKLADAATWLQNERFYAQAAALLAATKADFGDAVARDARIALLKHAQHHEDISFAPSDPRAPVARVMELLLERTIDLQKVASQMSPRFLDKMPVAAFGRQLYWIGAEARQQAQMGQPADRLIDLALARLGYDAEGGAEVGYRVRVTGLMAEPISFFVVREEQELHLIGTSLNPSPMGALALDLLDSHRLDLARQWLDRARDCIKESDASSFAHRGFARLWSRGQNASEDDSRIAAAALAAMYRAGSREIDVLKSAHASAIGERRGTLGAALAVGYVGASRWLEAIPLLEEGLRADRHWSGALQALVTAQIETGDFAAAERDIGEYGESDAQATRLRAQVFFARRDVAKARELLGELLQSGEATSSDRNLYAWMTVAQASPDAKALDVQRDLVASLGGREYSAVHTLACLYAMNGRGAEAREVLRALVIAFGGTIESSLVELIQGLLAESYGELALARRFFQQASGDTEKQTALGSAQMARLRLGLLDRPAGPRK
jgi:TonB family protein